MAQAPGFPRRNVRVPAPRGTSARPGQPRAQMSAARSATGAPQRVSSPPSARRGSTGTGWGSPPRTVPVYVHLGTFALLGRRPPQTRRVQRARSARPPRSCPRRAAACAVLGATAWQRPRRQPRRRARLAHLVQPPGFNLQCVQAGARWATTARSVPRHQRRCVRARAPAAAAAACTHCAANHVPRFYVHLRRGSVSPPGVCCTRSAAASLRTWRACRLRAPRGGSQI